MGETCAVQSGMLSQKGGSPRGRGSEHLRKKIGPEKVGYGVCGWKTGMLRAQNAQMHTASAKKGGTAKRLEGTGSHKRRSREQTLPQQKPHGPKSKANAHGAKPSERSGGRTKGKNQAVELLWNKPEGPTSVGQKAFRRESSKHVNFVSETHERKAQKRPHSPQRGKAKGPASKRRCRPLFRREKGKSGIT